MTSAPDKFSSEMVVSAVLQLDCWRKFSAGNPCGWPEPIQISISILANISISPADSAIDVTTPDDQPQPTRTASATNASNATNATNASNVTCIVRGGRSVQVFDYLSLTDCLMLSTASDSAAAAELESVVSRAKDGQSFYANAVGTTLRRNGIVDHAMFSVSCIPIADSLQHTAGVLISCTELVVTSTREAGAPAWNPVPSRRIAMVPGDAGDEVIGEALQLQMHAEGDESHQLFDSMDEGFALIAPDWTIRQINAAGLRLAGRSLSAVIGHNVWEVWPHARGTQVEKEFARVMQNGQSVNFEELMSFASCDHRWYDIRIYPTVQGGLAIFCRDITPRRDTENALRKSEIISRDHSDYLHLLLDTMTEGLYALDRGMKVTMCNAAFVRMLGFTDSDPIVGHELHQKIHHSHADGTPYPREDCRIYRAARDGTSVYVDDEVFFRVDGSSFPIEYRVRPIWHDGELHGSMCTFADISERKHAERELKESEQRFRSLFTHHMDAILASRLDGTFTESNLMMQQLTGYSDTELRALQVGSLAPEEEADVPRRHFMLAVSGTPQKFQSSLRRKDGQILQVEATHIPIIVDTGVIGIYIAIRDITAAIDYERHIRYLASHDALTGLPNRNLLDDRLRHAIFQRGKNQVGVLFLDLNRFKMINDSLGHDKGDLVLKIIADRLKVGLRQGDTIARLGGDEFVVVLEEIESVEQISVIAQKLLSEVEQAINLEGHEVSVSTSIGIAVYPQDGTDADTLLKHADLAMYQAKNAGSGTFRFFSPEMNIKTLERLLNETGLRRVIDRNELIVHYQPRVNVVSGLTVGVEALVRWMHPEHGIIAPNDFIPLAEEIGMIGAIGEWVLQVACRQNRSWQDAGLPKTKMSINLSAHQLLSPVFADTLERIVRESGLAVDWLELEITETSLMQNIDASLDTLIRIQQMGISISIDDFGTGYSSLSYLKKLPVDTLKIDQSFIRDLLDHPDDAVIVAATIGLAHSMGLQVVAEGVATAEQARFLMEKDCTTMQGFLFSKPLSASQCAHFLGRGSMHFSDGFVQTRH